jgi:hypothetical protein
LAISLSYIYPEQGEDAPLAVRLELQQLPQRRLRARAAAPAAARLPHPCQILPLPI